MVEERRVLRIKQPAIAFESAKISPDFEMIYLALGFVFQLARIFGKRAQLVQPFLQCLFYLPSDFLSLAGRQIQLARRRQANRRQFAG